MPARTCPETGFPLGDQGSAHSPGLGNPATEAIEHLWIQRGYITLIRQNGHLRPCPRLPELIDRSPEQMAYVLKEDDFLWNKLGRMKRIFTRAKPDETGERQES